MRNVTSWFLEKWWITDCATVFVNSYGFFAVSSKKQTLVHTAAQVHILPFIPYQRTPNALAANRS
jgi:hypothetical protein